MPTQTIIIIYGLIAFGIFLAIVLLTRTIIIAREKRAKKKLQKANISNLISKFFTEEKAEDKHLKLNEVEVMKRKIKNDIMVKSTQRAHVAEKSLKNSSEETLIEEGGKLFSSFSAGFRSAMPKSERERNKDIEDLIEAVKVLEGFDQDHYYQKRESEENMGKGMFYYNITKKLANLMKKANLKKEPLFIFDKLIYLGLKNIKNVSRKDLIDSLLYLKEGGYVKDYIEINPQIFVISQKKEKIRLSSPEKVVLVFAYEHDNLTISKLMEDAKWAEDYAEKIINGLIRKGIVSISENIITIKGFESIDEKKMRMELEEEINKKFELEYKSKLEQQKSIEEEFEKQEQDILGQLESDSLIEDENVDQSKIAEDKKQAETIKKLDKPSIKPLNSPIKPLKDAKLVQSKPINVPKPSQEVGLNEHELTGIDDTLKKEITKHQEIQDDLIESIASDEGVTNSISKDSTSVNSILEEDETDLNVGKHNPTDDMDELLNVIGTIDEDTNRPVVEEEDNSALKKEIMEDLEAYFESSVNSEYVGDDIEDETGDEAIADWIISIYEKYEHINGGLMDIWLIQKLLQEDHQDITMDQILDTIEPLKKIGLITADITLDTDRILLFKKIELDEDMKEIIKIISKNGPLTESEISNSLGWDKEKTLAAMKKLQTLEVMRLDENNKVVIQGLYSE